jgi:hypothetical protein
MQIKTGVHVTHKLRAIREQKKIATDTAMTNLLSIHSHSEFQKLTLFVEKDSNSTTSKL